jgi:hypothetical protein
MHGGEGKAQAEGQAWPLALGEQSTHSSDENKDDEHEPIGWSVDEEPNGAEHLAHESAAADARLHLELGTLLAPLLVGHALLLGLEVGLADQSQRGAVE